MLLSQSRPEDLPETKSSPSFPSPAAANADPKLSALGEGL